MIERDKHSPHTQLKLLVSTHRFVSQPYDVRNRASSTVLHDNPQVCVLEVAAVVLDYIRTMSRNNTQNEKLPFRAS